MYTTKTMGAPRSPEFSKTHTEMSLKFEFDPSFYVKSKTNTSLQFNLITKRYWLCYLEIFVICDYNSDEIIHCPTLQSHLRTKVKKTQKIWSRCSRHCHEYWKFRWSRLSWQEHGRLWDFGTKRYSWNDRQVSLSPKHKWIELRMSLEAGFHSSALPYH